MSAYTQSATVSHFVTPPSFRTVISQYLVILQVAREPFALQFTILHGSTLISYRNSNYLESLQLAREPFVLQFTILREHQFHFVLLFYNTWCLGSLLRLAAGRTNTAGKPVNTPIYWSPSHLLLGFVRWRNRSSGQGTFHTCVVVLCDRS